MKISSRPIPSPSGRTLHVATDVTRRLVALHRPPPGVLSAPRVAKAKEPWERLVTTRIFSGPRLRRCRARPWPETSSREAADACAESARPSAPVRGGCAPPSRSTRAERPAPIPATCRARSAGSSKKCVGQFTHGVRSGAQSFGPRSCRSRRDGNGRAGFECDPSWKGQIAACERGRPPLILSGLSRSEPLVRIRARNPPQPRSRISAPGATA